MSEGRFPGAFVHPTALVDEGAVIGEGTKVWCFSHIQAGAVIGRGCTLGQNVNVADNVHVGDGCKVQNNVSLYEGVELADGVFCGPSCVFTNDLTPRAPYPKGRAGYRRTVVGRGASIGANATVVCGHALGEWCMVGAGAVVTGDVPAHALVVGVPARRVGWVCECGERLDADLACSACGRRYHEAGAGLKGGAVMEFRDLKAQYAALKPAVDGAVGAVLSSGRFIGGAPVAELEGALADYVAVAHCLTCANGTDALELALLAWGVGEGDAVFVPDFTFFSSGEVVPLVGATPVFVDVDPATYNMDPASLRRAVAWVRENTGLAPKAVVAVDLFGLPADLPAIREVCDGEGMFLLEDGAQGFGGRIGEARACSFGDISTTSFFPAKPLGCYGDGGAVFTDDDGWDALMRSIAVHGKGTMKYDNVRLGMNSRLDTLQAAVLSVKLEAFAGYEVADVNRVAAWYGEALSFLGARGWGLPEVPQGYLSSWAQYTVRVPEGADRAAVQATLKDQGVPTMVYYPRPMHRQPAFDGVGLCPDGCPVTCELCGRVLSLPMGPYMGRDDVERVAAALEAL